MANILIIDDSVDLCEMLKIALERDYHRVSVLTCTKELKKEFILHADLILLDVMLPQEDGFSICKRIRQTTDCPIIFLSAKEQEQDILEGLASGGDDYLTKPVRIKELRARVAAHLRRERRTPISRYISGDIIFNLSAHTVTCKEKQIDLTKKEYELCYILAKNEGRVLSREQLLETAFGLECEAEHGAITEHIKNIRNKLSFYHIAPIETVWGIGYKWNAEKAILSVQS